MSPRAKTNAIRVGLIGYGGAVKMGSLHSEQMAQTGILQTVAVCDVDPKCLRQAKKDFGSDVLTFPSAERMLAEDVVDMCVVITPHNTHAKLAIQCLNAGKHVVVEKPMCITYNEATRMIAAARKNRVMLSVFHNRRWDGDYLAIKKCIADGLIGEIFHIEACMAEWEKPRKWWRSDKQISGGAFYDWGAHYLDWVLGLVPEAKMTHVTGFFHQDVVWKQTNEDQVQAIIRFDTGCVADVQLSSVAFAPRAHWRILGTKGAIEDWGQPHKWPRPRSSFAVRTEVKGYPAKMEVDYLESQWPAYYQNIADHLMKGTELVVKPEESARTIAIMEYAEKSSRHSRTLKPPCP